MDKTLHTSNAGGSGLIPSWGTKKPHAVWPKKKCTLNYYSCDWFTQRWFSTQTWSSPSGWSLCCLSNLVLTYLLLLLNSNLPLHSAYLVFKFCCLWQLMFWEHSSDDALIPEFPLTAIVTYSYLFDFGSFLTYLLNVLKLFFLNFFMESKIFAVRSRILL